MARSTPAGAGAVGVPVATKGSVPRAVGLDRATLAAAGFEGKVGQTLVVPQRDGATVVVIGVGGGGGERRARPGTSAAVAPAAGN